MRIAVEVNAAVSKTTHFWHLIDHRHVLLGDSELE